MKFIIKREHLIKPLQQVSNTLGVRRPLLPILNNILLQINKDNLLLTGTDLELEIVAKVVLNNFYEQSVATTVPARKFFDICRGLPAEAEIAVTLVEGERILIKSGRSRYLLSTLPAVNFPNIDDWQIIVQFTIKQSSLKKLIESTQFSMAHQDVRYYLNGMLFETEVDALRAVATDGHRLAMCVIPVIGNILPLHSVIIPRKSIIELVRILDSSDNPVKVQIGSNNIRISVGNYMFTSKLVNGRFPDYRRVFLKNPDKKIEAKCEALKQALTRAAILSSDRFHGVRLYLSTNQLKITANNPKQEEAEEIIDAYYHGSEVEIAFNVSYVLDVLNALKCDVVRILLTDGVSSVQIVDSANKVAIYIIMPIRL
ncbi:DNA polymerase III subunit beta [secondary endosymbiont of Trabutina mannipara]|uniref:Beta sliding clamp n=1 Tax=secondary endosymbiont of Trabutina mannipara TaxID=1835721 RepID=A0A1C3L478_9ENTR|nr:DNA polymerase III subunit beta [secondary endosymbiont of Trabutina mannipara]SBT82071.1 DNA polymerase III subunit beta [secondary endosymbiont of Trabutina mannipara]